jgi:hypothetical protein
MNRIQHFCFASSLLPLGVQGNYQRHNGLRCLAIIGLALVICLGSMPPAQAQKKPAALGPNAPLSPDSKSYYEEVAAAYKADVGPGGSASKALVDRNRLIYLAIDQMDLNFYDFQKSTRKKRAFFQTVLDILEIGASTAISITNGERAKTLIAEGLGAVQAGRTSINKNFALKDTQILFNKMVAKRAQILGQILTKSVQGVDQYPFEAALIDLIGYYRAGTFDGALENLNIDTGSEAAAATKAVAALKIATTAQLKSAISLDALLVDLFARAKNNDAAAIAKLKAALTTLAAQNIAPDIIKPAAIPTLSVQQLDDLYFDLRVKFLEDDQRGNLQKLADALK